MASAVRGLVAPLTAFAVGALAPSMWRVHPEGVALTVCLLLLGGLQLPVWRLAPALAAGLVGSLLWTALAAHERTATVVLPIVAASLAASALAGVCPRCYRAGERVHVPVHPGYRA
jgi:hypothetical protein